MDAIEARVAAALLRCAPGSDSPPSLSVCFFEIAGKKGIDLLSEARGEVAVTLREEAPGRGGAAGGAGGGVGRAELSGATRRVASTPAELAELIAEGKSRRAVSATFANAASSRSHAVLRLTLPGCGGSLTLVDCAGSERKEDNGEHDAAQRAEGAEINASLYALKECIRARARADAATASSGHVHVPYRSSLLTRVLAECLSRGDAALGVVGTLSPCAADTEHSLSTLQTVALLSARDGEAGLWREAREDVAAGLEVAPDGRVVSNQPDRVVPPVQWRPAELKAWLGAARGGAFAGAAAAAPDWMAGRDVARMTPAGVASVLCGGDAQLGQKLYDALREEVARAAAAKAAKT